MPKIRRGGTEFKFQDEKGQWKKKFIPGAVPKGCKQPVRICIKCLKGRIKRRSENWRWKVCVTCWSAMSLDDRVQWIARLAEEKGEEYAAAVNLSKDPRPKRSDTQPPPKEGGRGKWRKKKKK